MGFNYEDRVFIDVGCGLGKACFSAIDFKFKHIRGFDFDDKLITGAKLNLSEVKKKLKIDIDFQPGDAAEVILAPEKMFIFMFNPFDDVVMRKFLNNNLQSLTGKCVLGYANDRQKDVLREFGFQQIYQSPERKLSLWKI